MFQVFIDTCVWFDIAEDPKRFPQLAVIEEMVRRGLMQLIVPRLAIREFHRKRETIAQTSETSLLPHVQAVRQAAMKLGGHKKKVEAFLGHLDEIATHIPIEGGGAAQALDRIEHLLSTAPVIEGSDHVAMAAVQRGIDRRAPFHDRNSMADAILLETYAKCVCDAMPDSRFVFVTSNKNDFSHMHVNESWPHPHLKDIFLPERSHYFIDLVAALKHIDPAVVDATVTREQPTVREVIESYLETNPPIGDSGRAMLGKVGAMHIGTKRVSKLRPHDYLEHAETRRKTVVASTAMQDFIWLKGAFVWAQTNWSTDVSLQALDRARTAALKQGLIAKSQESPVKRLSREDEKRLMEALAKRQQHPKNRTNVADIVQFALWSGRRRDEICRLRWEDFHRDSSTCAVQDAQRKGRTIRFPLLGRALDIVLKQEKLTGTGKLIFPYKAQSVGKAFLEVKQSLGIDITFDDLREEGIRRFLEAREYPIEQIMQLDRPKVAEIQMQMEAGKMK